MKHLTIFALVLAFLNSYGEFHQGTIINKNGRSRTGYIEAKFGDVIRFKPWMKAEEEQIGIESIKVLLIKTDSGRQIREYHYIQVSATVKKGNARIWLRLVEQGTVSLYVQETVSNHAGVDRFDSGDFYCLHEGEATAKPVASSESNHIFKAKAPLYFADCVQLVEKIKSKQYSWQNIQEVVQIYNQWLANNKLKKAA